MKDYILFWMAQGLAGLAWFAIFCGVIILLFVVFVAYAHLRVLVCKHDYKEVDKHSWCKSDSLKELKCTKCGNTKRKL